MISSDILPLKKQLSKLLACDILSASAVTDILDCLAKERMTTALLKSSSLGTIVGKLRKHENGEIKLDRLMDRKGTQNRNKYVYDQIKWVKPNDRSNYLLCLY